MKVFLKILSISSYVFSVLVLITIGVMLYYYLKYRRAVQYTMQNSIFCGNPKCPMDYVDLPEPTDIPTGMRSYSLPLARYRADLVLRSVNSFSDKTAFPVPPGMLELGELYSDQARQTVFGKILLLVSQKTIFVVFRGTQTIEEMKGDLDYNQTYRVSTAPAHQMRQVRLRHGPVTVARPGVLAQPFEVDVPLVHGGFQQIYDINKARIKQCLEANGDVRRVIFCGHSLGAAVAVIGALDTLTSENYSVAVYNFGQPRVGNEAYSKYAAASGLTIFKHVNTYDIIPTLPPAVVPNTAEYTNPYFFAEIGTEISFSKNHFSILLNHLLPSYIDNLILREEQPGNSA